MNKYILSYVNTKDETIFFDSTQYLDLEFKSLIDLENFILIYHPNFTSYQIIVIKCS